MIDLDNITLSEVFQKRKNDRDIFQELMPSKVKEILLVATRYDAYSIVREGQFSDKIFGEYLQLNLYSLHALPVQTASTKPWTCS